MLWFDVLLVFLWGGGAAAALSYCMNISRYNIVFGAIVGGLGWTVYSVTIAVGQSAGTQSYFWGALVVAILSEILALVQKKPATIYLVPGLLPLVPGGGMFAAPTWAGIGILTGLTAAPTWAGIGMLTG